MDKDAQRGNVWFKDMYRRYKNRSVLKMRIRIRNIRKPKKKKKQIQISNQNISKELSLETEEKKDFRK